MKIGIPKEIKDKEGRVALTPEGARQLVADGHEVVVESGAGLGSGFDDGLYRAAGASIANVDAAWDVDLVVKVKEPLESEYPRLGRQIVFTYFHLAGAPRGLTEALLAGGTTAVAYETLEDENGRLPLLAPMSAIAGNMAAMVGAYYLGKTQGGRGVQLGEVLGVRHGRVLVIGDGVVGYHAAKSAWGLGAQEVAVAGLLPARRDVLHREISPDIAFFESSPEAIASRLPETDLLIGGVLRHGARAEFVVTEAMVRTMPAGAVIVDVSIDQGGCIETSQPTSHSNPVYDKHGVVHYCVTNMPGAYPRTSTLALTQATLPYVLKLANGGIGVLKSDPGLYKAVNVAEGAIAYRPVADDLGMSNRYRPF